MTTLEFYLLFAMVFGVAMVSRDALLDRKVRWGEVFGALIWPLLLGIYIGVWMNQIDDAYSREAAKAPK